MITTSDTNENFTIDPNGNGMTRILGGTAIGDTLTATTDRYLYFGTDGSYTNEFLKWDEATTNFILSDSLYASGYVGLGTMAIQNANAVAITGGTASLDTLQIDSGKTIILPKSGELTNGQFAVIKGIRLTAGYGTTAIGDLVYLNNNDSKFEKTDADTAVTAADVLVGVVCEAVAENADCLIMLEGTMTVDSWNWGTPGASLWISETAGEFEETLGNISDINDIVRPVAYVLDDDTIYFHGGTAYATKE